MTARLEDKIRDFLAANLGMLEDGLTLVSKEYPLENAFGAGGRIDVVSRDKFGHVVVIEIKRSDQSSRQAVNEICKYVALFRLNQGLGADRIRLLVVSTAWHELLLPLSEFAATTDYSVEGLKIIALDDGTVTDVSNVTLIPSTAEAQVNRQQSIFLFSKLADRDSFLSKIETAAGQAGVSDFFVLHCDYKGTSSNVVYPHAAYFCFSSPLLSLTPDEAAQCKAKIDWEDLDEPDENFLVAMNKFLRKDIDSYEIGYPEKLSNISQEWGISMAKRNGRFNGGASLLSDDDLISLAKSIGGGSAIYVGRITSPRFEANWAKLTDDLKNALRGNQVWLETVPLILAEIEQTLPRATVAVAAYVPANLLVSLYYAAIVGDASRIPVLEVFSSLSLL